MDWQQRQRGNTIFSLEANPVCAAQVQKLICTLLWSQHRHRTLTAEYQAPATAAALSPLWQSAEMQ
jgi:hypothetical protein